MAIKKHSFKKHCSRKNKKNSTKHTKKHSKSHRKHKNKSAIKSASKNANKNIMHRGGFTDCNLASIKEPGFNIPTLGVADGLSIPESRGAIYRPNCKTDTYQAMTP